MSHFKRDNPRVNIHRYVSPDQLIDVDPEHEVDTKVGSWGLATAVFSAGRLHRYHLSRVWAAEKPRVNFLMLNPSTADALKLDPTVTRCANFARSWGYGQLAVTNCFALRSTDPAGLRQVEDPVGVGNDAAIVAAALAADRVVGAWGVHAVYRDREAQVRRLLADAGVAVHMLQMTKHGHPAHPLYVRGTTTPQPW
jgi:hypothetical protein